jgi:hypothetical protein
MTNFISFAISYKMIIVGNDIQTLHTTQIKNLKIDGKSHG